MRTYGPTVAVALVIALLSIASGCQERFPPKPSGPQLQKDDRTAGYLELPGMQNASTVLRGMYDQIERERLTPAGIAVMDSADQDNLALFIPAQFRSPKPESLYEDTDRIMPSKDFDVSLSWLSEAQGFLDMLDQELEQIQDKVESPTSCFEPEYNDYFAIEPDVIYSVWVYARLEAFQAAVYFRASDLDSAIDCVGRLMTLADLLDDEPNLPLRLQAAYIRTEALKIAQALAFHPGFKRPQLLSLQQIVLNNLACWTPDEKAWQGERAAGLWLFEAVRDGKIDEVLTDDELDRLKSGGVYDMIVSGDPQLLDQDQVWFVSTMQRVIEAAQDPYYDRLDVIESIENELGDLQNKPGYPAFSDNILMPGLREMQKIQARDRANLEAWALACSLALGETKQPRYEVNPMTGQPYLIRVDDDPEGEWPGGAVYVTGVGEGIKQGDDPPVVLPVVQ